MISLEEKLIDRVFRWNWPVLGLFLAVSLVLWNFSISLGVLAGGLLALANFHFLHRSLKKQFQAGNRPSIMGVVGRSYLRFAATGVIILVLFVFNLVNPIALIVGLSVVVLNLTLSGFSLFRQALLKEAL
jgi:hypothetical protein